MGLIRGSLVAIASIVLFLCFFAGNVFLTLAWSLEYETIKPELESIVGEIVAQQGINLDEIMREYSDEMETYCENNSEYVFSEQGHVFRFSCDEVLQGHEAMIEQGVGNLIEEYYYKDYDCEFWACLQQVDNGQPFVLVSEKARDYWKQKFYLTLGISIILIVLMFFLVEEKYSLFIIAGSLLLVSSLPFMKLNWALSFISDESFFRFFSSFFSKAYNVFLINFIIGLAVLGTGIGLKFFSIGFKISNFLSKKDESNDVVSKKEVKKIVKEEVSKKK